MAEYLQPHFTFIINGFNMRKPTKPRAPTKPTPPEKIKIEEILIDFPEGIFKISTIGDIVKEYCERFDYYKPVVKDWSHIEIRHEWRYESMEFIALVPCKNLRYNQELVSYNKRVKTYEKRMQDYSKKLTAYEAALSLWKKDQKPKIKKSLEKKKKDLEAEIARLQKTLDGIGA